jgi:phosphoglycolate phosphatase
MMAPRDPDAVIFDLDGTLIDSIGIYFRILDTAFDRMGLPRADREKVAEAARDGEFNWALVLPDAPENEQAATIAEVQHHIWAVYPDMLERYLRLIPGAVPVLETFLRRGIQMAIVTSTPAEAMPHKLRPLKEAGVDGHFAAVITAGDVAFKKPHAEPMTTCARRLAVDPHRCVVVGDSCVDIRAGKAAAMGTVGVLTGFDNRQILEKEGADAVLPSVRQLPETVFFRTAG